jgi:hypothetical protein
MRAFSAGRACSVFVAVAAALVAATAAQAKDRIHPITPTLPAPTLAGESLLGSTDAAAATFDGTCLAAGPSDFHFIVSGSASGALPGTFVESGTFTIDAGRLVSFHSDFTITSRAGTAVGARDLSPAQLEGATAFCGEVAWGFHDGVVLSFDSTYAATVRTPGRSTPSAGTAGFTYSDVGSRSVPSGMTAFQFIASPS